MVNRTAEVVGGFAFEHSGAELSDFMRSLDKLKCAMVDRVAIVAETPRGLIIGCLL